MEVKVSSSRENACCLSHGPLTQFRAWIWRRPEKSRWCLRFEESFRASLLVHPIHKMILRQIRPSLLSVRSLAPRNAKRRLVAPPRPNSGPLLERRADRELPPSNPPNMFLRTFPIFLVVLAASAAGLFNYQKLNSSVVTSSLYALRINEDARELLGDEIYFSSKVPWIWGTINQLHGNIDIHFGVKGTRGKGEMYFRCTRKTRMGFFETEEWSLDMGDGRRVDLLEKGGEGPSTGDRDENKAGKFI